MNVYTVQQIYIIFKFHIFYYLLHVLVSKGMQMQIVQTTSNPNVLVAVSKDMWQ